jgi:hypothetical protein
MSEEAAKIAVEHFDGFSVRFKYLPHWADVEVFEHIGINQPILYNKKDAVSLPDPVESIDEAEPYLTGYIKWDGCSEFEFGRPHWCGPRSYLLHFRILETIYKRAQELMPSGNDDPWPETASSAYDAKCAEVEELRSQLKAAQRALLNSAIDAAMGEK